MKVSQLDKCIFISDQIVDSDLQDIAGKNIKTIICHRPDDEGADQPDFEEIAKQAKKLNIECHYIPVVSGKISDEDVKNFSKIYAEAPKPVLSYCRSGMRAATM